MARFFDHPLYVKTIGSRCEQLNYRAAKLQADAHKFISAAAFSDNRSRITDITQECQKLNDEFENYAAMMPPEFCWRMVAWEPRHPRDDCSDMEVFPGRVDMYNDLSIARLWNSMRCARLMLLCTIVRCEAWRTYPVDYRTAPTYTTIARTCAELIADIIASVPYLSGLPVVEGRVVRSPRLSGLRCGNDDRRKGVMGYFLLWPLTSILWQDYLTAAQRTWVKGRLKYIGTELGIMFGNCLGQVRR